MQVREYREKTMTRLECAADLVVATGAVRKWFEGVSPTAKQVVQHVNGPLLEKLARGIDFHDAECVKLLRDGGRLTGTLDRQVEYWRGAT